MLIGQITNANVGLWLAGHLSFRFGCVANWVIGQRTHLEMLNLEKELKALGLAPGNGDSYRQEVPIVEITAFPD